jgi:hypothetical protein
MARKSYDYLVIDTPQMGTEINCQEATADFKARFEAECDLPVIVQPGPWWGSKELDRSQITECSDEEFSLLLETWNQIVSEINEEYGE